MKTNMCLAAVLSLACVASGAGAADAVFTQKAMAAAKDVKAGRFDAALISLDQMVRRYPKATDIDLIYWLTCKAHIGKGAYKAAIGYCAAAILRNPKNANYVLDRAYAYYRLGDGANAKRDLVAALNKGSTKAQAHGLLARLAWQAGDEATAQAQTAQALKRDPKNAEALGVREEMRLAKTMPAGRPMPRPAPPSVPPKPALRVAMAKPVAKPASSASGVAPPRAVAASPPAPASAPVPVLAQPAPAHTHQQVPPPPMVAAKPQPGAPSWWTDTPPIPATMPPAPRAAAYAEDLDCAVPRFEAERLICRDQALRRDAQALDHLFWRAQAMAAAPNEMASAQRDWIALHRNRCRTRACVRAAYAERRAELMLWVGD